MPCGRVAANGLADNSAGWHLLILPIDEEVVIHLLIPVPIMNPSQISVSPQPRAGGWASLGSRCSKRIVTICRLVYNSRSNTRSLCAPSCRLRAGSGGYSQGYALVGSRYEVSASLLGVALARQATLLAAQQMHACMHPCTTCNACDAVPDMPSWPPFFPSASTAESIRSRPRNRERGSILLIQPRQVPLILISDTINLGDHLSTSALPLSMSQQDTHTGLHRSAVIPVCCRCWATATVWMTVRGRPYTQSLTITQRYAWRSARFRR